MLVFSTRIPLKNNVTVKDCLHLFIEWIVNSPHYNIDKIDYDLTSYTDFTVTKENITFSICHYKDEKVKISACRLENKENDAVWFNDCVFLDENGKKSLLVQLNCNRVNFKVKLPPINKPHIVKKFIESNFCEFDAKIPVTSSPIDSDNDFFDTCVEVMNGISENIMPVVYISCDYWGKTALNPEYMARQLAGVAHVFVERKCDTAIQLRSASNGNNAYNSYIGVYFPSTTHCEKFGLENYKNYRCLSRAVIDSVWRAMINQLDASVYNWNHIQTLQSRQKMAEFKDISEKDKQELDLFVSSFDAEHSDLRQKIDDLNKQLQSKQSQIEGLQAQIGSDKDGRSFYKTGTEPELYSGEYNDLLFSILSFVKNKYKDDSRAHILIQSLLSANPRVGECKRIMNVIESIFNKGGKLSKVDLNQLKSLGFTITDDGRHFKMMFHDPRYMFAISKTPSDFRDGKNAVSSIRKVLDVEKNL